jgi:signal transduction histidine kinase
MQDFGSVLLEEDSGDFSAAQRDYLERIARAARRMDCLTLDLLHYNQLGRSEAAAARFESVRLLPSVSASATGLTQVLGAASIK